jgi:hypothetical protein
MASTKYIGYVGGVAVAAGVGAAIAVAGQGTAHADSTGGATKDSTSNTSQHVKAGPKRGDSKTGDTKRVKPLSKVKDNVKDNLDKQADKIEKAAAHVTKSANTVSTSITDSLNKAVKSAKPMAVKSAKPSAEEFEAEQVAKLKGLFSPKQAAAPKPEPDPVAPDKQDKTVTESAGTLVAPKVGAVQTRARTTADAPAWDPNPFRADDPDPTDFPETIMKLRQALLDASPDVLDPFVREATEQIYRGSQIVPWVNAVIPIGKIVENLTPALGNDAAALDARQTIINELIKTTPPGSFLYYGYDIAADLLNLEEPGAALKIQAVATVWDLLDPLHLAHNPGKSGIGGSAG